MLKKKHMHENLFPQHIFLTKENAFSKHVTKLINMGNTSTKQHVDINYLIT